LTTSHLRRWTRFGQPKGSELTPRAAFSAVDRQPKPVFRVDFQPSKRRFSSRRHNDRSQIIRRCLPPYLGRRSWGRLFRPLG